MNLEFLRIAIVVGCAGALTIGAILHFRQIGAGPGLFQTLFGGFLFGGMLYQILTERRLELHLRDIKADPVSFVWRISAGTVGGLALLGLFSVVLKSTQTEPPDNAVIFAALFPIVGALCGWFLHYTRPRTCPKCGKCMGRHASDRAVDPNHRIPDEKYLVTIEHGRKGPRTHYLCKNCDLEFLPQDLLVGRSTDGTP